MTKADIVERIVAETSVPPKKALAAVNTVLEAIREVLGQGDRIELRGFGIFEVKPRKSGIGRNPKTGARAPIPPGKAVRFKLGKELRWTGKPGLSPSSLGSAGGG